MQAPAPNEPASSDDDDEAHYGAADCGAGACLGATAPDDRCLCALLTRTTRLRQLDGWQQYDEPQRSAGGGGGGGRPNRCDAGGRKPRVVARDALAAAGGGHDRTYEFQHRADDIGWYIKEYREKCAKSSRQPAMAAARLPALVATRQFVSFRRPIRVPTIGDSRTLDDSTAAMLPPTAGTPTRSRSSSSAEGDASADGGGAAAAANVSSAAQAGEPRNRRIGQPVGAASSERSRRMPAVDRSARGMARSASVAVADVASTIVEMNQFGKSRSSSALERADVSAAAATRALLLSRDAAALAASAVCEKQPGFLTLEERSHRSAAAAAAASKARALRHRRAAGGDAAGTSSAGAADGAADDAFVKEKQFVFPLPAKVRSLAAAAGKASTRVGAQRQQAAAASAPPAPTPPARGRGLGGGSGGSSRLARTLGELIDDFRRERRSLAALGAAPELSVAAAAAAALAAAAARSGTSRRRARAGSQRKGRYFHLPLAGPYPYAGEMMDSGSHKGGVGRMAHAELFDFTSSAAAAVATCSRALRD